MIESFADKATEDMFNGLNSSEARRRLPTELWRNAFRKLDQIDSAVQIEDLRVPPGNRLELLKGNRTGQHGIRINDQYRICFEGTETGATRVEIVDYH